MEITREENLAIQESKILFYLQESVREFRGEFDWDGQTTHEFCKDWALTEMGLTLGGVETVPPYEYLVARSGEVCSYSAAFDEWREVDFDTYGRDVYDRWMLSDPWGSDANYIR